MGQCRSGRGDCRRFGGVCARAGGRRQTTVTVELRGCTIRRLATAGTMDQERRAMDRECQLKRNGGRQISCGGWVECKHTVAATKGGRLLLDVVQSFHRVAEGEGADMEMEVCLRGADHRPRARAWKATLCAACRGLSQRGKAGNEMGKGENWERGFYLRPVVPVSTCPILPPAKPKRDGREAGASRPGPRG